MRVEHREGIARGYKNVRKATYSIPMLLRATYIHNTYNRLLTTPQTYDFPLQSTYGLLTAQRGKKKVVKKLYISSPILEAYDDA